MGNGNDKSRITHMQRRMVNVLLFFDLFRLERKMLPDIKKECRIQNRNIKKLMKRAYDIPFYRSRFDAAGVTPKDFQCAEDLYKFPLLTKQDLREWMDEESPKEKYRYYYLDTTSGSSGNPTKILYSPKEKAMNMANWMRVMVKAGYNPFRGKTVNRINMHDPDGKQDNFLQKFGLLRREFIDQYAPENEVIDAINKSRPDLLYMNKTELMRIALYSKQNNYTVFHPSLYVGVGEKVDDAARKLFQEVFGPNLLDSYGSAETGACMARFPGRKNYLIHNDIFVVNLWDEDNHPTRHGRVVVTPLYKTDIPLINYVVGDQASSGTEFGRTVITEIEGRMNDFIRHENGQVTTFFMIAPVFAHCEEVLQFRVIQKSYDLLIVQAVRDNTSSKSVEEIEADLRPQLEQALQQPMDIQFEWLNVIEPDPNGKLRLIVNEI